MILSALGVFLDLAVLISLGVTVYYAHKLTQGLNLFRQTRQEMGAMMKNLSVSIDDAQAAVDGLKRATKTSGEELQKKINESKKMLSELEILNKASEKIAARLDGAPDKNRRPFDAPRDFSAPSKPALPEKKPAEKMPSFVIHDRDFDKAPDAAGAAPDNLGSQAERDLLAALMGRKAG